MEGESNFGIRCREEEKADLNEGRKLNQGILAKSVPKVVGVWILSWFWFSILLFFPFS